MSQATVKISSAPRALPGSGQTATTFVPAQVVATWSWGLQPATALIDWVSASAQPSIVAGAGIEIDVGGHTFYGFTDSVVLRVGSDGSSLMQEFKDNRDYLMWDMVYGAFNLQENKIVNGQYLRRYRHLLPGNYNAGTWNYTNTPYTAAQILNFLFAAGTVETNWNPIYHSLMNNPVYDLDYTNGVKFGQALVDISEKLGLVFTLIGGPYTLQWELKGAGTLPGFPANSDNRRLGTALSGNPTRLRVLGDRNRYECLNCPLEADWGPVWQNFWDFNAFINDIFWNERTEGPVAGPAGSFIAAGTPYASLPNDPDNLVGYALAGARARLLTVGQYAALRDARSNDGEAFRDYRRFQGRSRLNLPVMLYLTEVMFRAFRLPDNFRLRLANGLYADKYSFDIDTRAVVEVTHDPATGQMTALGNGAGGYEIPDSAHNGYAIVQGYQVAQDGFKTLRPEYFNLASWVSGQALWQAAPFTVDDSGAGDQFILFDEPVINSGNLIQQISASGQPQAYPDARPRVALNALATVYVPPVQAALTFLGERFSWVQGTGTRDDVVNVANLNGEYLTGYMLLTPGTSSTPPPGAVPFELQYVDGLTASQKAASYANVLLNGQYYYQNGGYTVQGSNATQLDPVTDRVTVRWDADGGLTEEVDFTNERSRNVTVGFGGVPTLQLEPEREFDRRSQLAALFSGQSELRQQANQLKLQAAILRANPRIAQTLTETFHRLMGLDAPTQTVLIAGGLAGGYGSVAVGTPLFREAGNNNATWPDGSKKFTNPVFVGVAVMHSENSAGGVRVTATGDNGVVQVMLRLQATDAPAPGVPVGLGSDKLARLTLELNPSLAVGTLLDDWSQNQAARVVFTRVRIGTTGGGGFMGEYDQTKSYTAGQTFLISTATTIAGVAVIAGYYGVPPAGTDVNGLPWTGNVPAGPTGNAVPQSPLPSLGASPNDKFYAKLIMPICI